jgi:hypothetical protein
MRGKPGKTGMRGKKRLLTQSLLESKKPDRNPTTIISFVQKNLASGRETSDLPAAIESDITFSNGRPFGTVSKPEFHLPLGNLGCRKTHET